MMKAVWTKGRLLLVLVLVVFLAGCGGDVDKMKEGLRKSGLTPQQADCYAEKMDAEGVDKDPYNYIAELLVSGADQGDAFNKARRKFGPEWQLAAKSARKACGL